MRGRYPWDAPPAPGHSHPHVDAHDAGGEDNPDEAVGSGHGADSRLGAADVVVATGGASHLAPALRQPQRDIQCLVMAGAVLG